MLIRFLIIFLTNIYFIINVSFNNNILIKQNTDDENFKDGIFLRTRDLFKGSQLIQVGQREPYTAFITKITLPKYHCIDKLKLKTRTILTGAEDIEIVFEDCNGQWKLIHYSNLKNQFDFLKKIYAKTFAILSSKTIDDVREVFIGLCDTEEKKYIDNEYKNNCKLHKKNNKQTRKKRSKRFLGNSESSINVIFLNEQSNEIYEPIYQINITQKENVKREINNNVIRTCEPGWLGVNCNIADCSLKKNCSGAGYCVKPNECRCILNHYGDDCSLCQGPYCSHCDYHCVHGKCDFITKTCQCSNFWGGSACDVCLDEKKCLAMPKILMLLPQSGPILKQNTFVFALGTDFPKADSYRYSCIFGGIATEGRWLSSNLIRCMVPPVSHVGKHLFNLIPLNSNIKIDYLENRPIHYTFYVDCNPNVCQGSCMGPQCICGSDRSGIECESINVLSNEIYNQTKVNEELANAFEGVPYHVNVPIKSDSTLISLMSEAINYGLRFDAFKGQLIWENPIGRKEPYEINVLMNHGFMRYSLKWILNVTPSYEGRIISINSPEINDVLVKGFVKFDSKSRSFEAPLLIIIFSSNIQSNDSLVEIIKINSAQNGTFIQQLIPYSILTENYSLCITHPGVVDFKKNIFCEKSNEYSEGVWSISRLIPDYKPTLKCNKNKNKTLSNMIEGNYKIKSINFDCANSWEFDILFPREKISVRNLRFKEDGNSIMVEFVLKSNQCLEKKFNFIGLVFCPNSKMSSVIRQTIECQEIGSLRTEPEKLFTVVNPLTNFTESSSLKIFVSNEEKREKLLKNILLDSNIVKPFSIISLDGNDDFIEIELLYQSVKDITNTNGYLYLPNFDNPIVKVPYSIKFSTSTNINFSIYLRSLLDDSIKQNEEEAIATIYIRSPSNNISIFRGSKINDVAEFGNFITGTYSISVKANGYNDYYNIETIDDDKKILTIFLEPEFPYKPIISNDEYSMEKVQNNLKNIPLVSITPSFLTIDGSEKIFKQYMELHYEEGIESTFVAFNNIDLIYQMYKIDDKLYKIEMNALNETSLCLGCRIKVLLTITEQNTTLDDVIELHKGIIIKIDYFVLIRSINWNYKGSSDILIINKNSDKQLNLPLINKYQIMCNCYVSRLGKCLKDYQSVLGCSKSWDRIPDDIVSIHTFANFILLKADCERNGIQMKKIRKLLVCLNDIEQICPKVTNKNFGIQGNFPQQLKNTFLSSFPNINALELQLSEIPILFNYFLKQLDILIPDNEITQISDSRWFDNFIKFASDYSHGSNEITEQELLRFTNWHQGKSLIFRWNTMNKELEGEKNPLFTLMSNSTLFAFQDLVKQSDKLKSLSRQLNQETPFSMLHEILHTLFSNVESATSLVPTILDDSCKFNDVYVLNSAEKIFENESFKVILIIKSNSKMKSTINDIKLNLEIKKVDEQDANIQFRIIPSYNKYSPLDQMTIIEWVITPMIMRRLTNEITYKPVVLLKFKHPISGDISEQQLASQVISIIPMEFVRIYWFSYPYVTSENNKDLSQPYSTLLSIMNVGYVGLKNIELNKLKAYITSEDGDKRIPFKIVKNNTLMRIPHLLSGKSIQIPFDFYLEKDDQGILINMTLQLTTNGRFPAHIQSRYFHILQAINDRKLIVYERKSSSPMIHYDIEHSRMTPIQEALVSSGKIETINIEGNQFKYFILNVQRKLDQDTELKYGPLLIQFNTSSIIRDPSDQVKQISTFSNGRLRYIENDNIWSYDKKLNFVDLEARNNEEKIQYFVIFGNNEYNGNFSNFLETVKHYRNTSEGLEISQSINNDNTKFTTKKYIAFPEITETLFPPENASTKVTILEKDNTKQTLSSYKTNVKTTTLDNISSYTETPKIASIKTISQSTQLLPEKEKNFKNTSNLKDNNFYSPTFSPSEKLNETILLNTTQIPKKVNENSINDNNSKENLFIFSNNNNINIKSTTKFPFLESSTKNENTNDFIFISKEKSTEKPITNLLNTKTTKVLNLHNIVTTTLPYLTSIEDTKKEKTINLLHKSSANIFTTTLIYPENSLIPINQSIKDNINIINNNKYETTAGVETLFPKTIDVTTTKMFNLLSTTSSKENNITVENLENDFKLVSSSNNISTISSTTKTNNNFNFSDFVFAPLERNAIDNEIENNNEVFSKDYYKKVAYKIQKNPQETIQMACNNKKTHPIWGIICDLDKIFEIESKL